MGARGPKPDPDQAAKGNPGRRKSKAKAAAAVAARTAELMAPRASGEAELPALLRDEKYAPAALVWRQLAPELRRTHRLPLESEFSFVQFCVYAQEWVAATEDLHTNGFCQDVQTVAGGKMERRRPKQFDRQQAFQNMMELSGKFGLTPTDMYGLFKGQAAVAPSRPDLFGAERQASAGEPQPASGSSRIGGLGRLRSEPPPGARPN